MTLCDTGTLFGPCLFLAQAVDPVSTSGEVLVKYGWSGFLALCIVGMWWDSRRREDKAQAAAEKRDTAADERLKELNATLGDLKLLIGRLLEKHHAGDD